mmetsp:Transcript_2788/g.6791  ORF Transcript_2788/g.6791 Transcript_2788/m.6791 type:complete len:220 (-) Transcript_2788:273-932(-)
MRVRTRPEELLCRLHTAVHRQLTEFGCLLLSLGGRRGAGERVAMGRAAEGQELAIHGREVLEEQVLVLGVGLDPGAELWIVTQCHVCGKHHQFPGLFVLELQRAVPLPGLPGQIQQKDIVRVVKLERVMRPRPIEATASGVAASQGVGTAQGHNLLVIETHPVKHITQVLSALVGVGKTAVHGAGLAIGAIGPTKLERHLRAAQELQRNAAGIGPQVSV